MDADIPVTLADIYKKGVPASVGKLSPSAVVTAHGGRYGAAHRAPATKPDYSLWPKPDFDALVTAFKKQDSGHVTPIISTMTPTSPTLRLR
jgi:hypothetical protein